LVQIFAYIDSKKDYIHIISFEDGHKDTVTDVEWAPQFGRSYHLIATCSLDKKVIIWKLDLKYDTHHDKFENINVKKEMLKCFQFDCEVWRLSWNISGTLLSAIDDKGRIKLIKKIDEKEFEIISNLENN
jgi:nucleoporin SEH1